ncbi:hypothetical protein DPQ33_01250 [Oceanidesulfovibrio indonesiensis]|uniref:PAS domain-containing protein n=1 Tax=Oceanidesulfovibrio indonesiensis TaxID=54767 RepID=A0A7M3MJB6_9BACT|nr:PAS and helix-turn-helix domain-containing protein [Oceanidesulfovibrio indonesiensis]TVM19884.1 hypothetical protein DPQ33_01250 [Oceanidesulfovibrio indonesiensis]
MESMNRDHKLHNRTAGIGMVETHAGETDAESKEYTAAPEDTKALFTTLFATVEKPLLLFDNRGKVLAANPSARDLFGADGEMTGREASSLFGGDGGRRFLDEILDGNGRPASLEAVSCNDAAGNSVRANLRVTPARLSGSTCYQVFVDAQHDTGSLEQQLARKRRELDEMTITLKNVMETVTRDKRQLKSEMARQIEVELFPMLEKMSHEGASDIRRSYSEVIKRQLRRITGGAHAEPDPMLMKLTPTELEICRYIQAGQGTKEIAEMMHSAFETIQTHRKNIRRKLKLKGRKVSLCMYLQSRATLPPPGGAFDSFEAEDQ